MSRLLCRVSLLAALMVPCSLAHAGDPGQYQGYNAYGQPLAYGPAHTGMANAWVGVEPHGHGSTRLDPPLYPSPVQYVPREVGSTMVTNPAFNPQEMLWSHEYHALYGPFYFKRTGLFPWLRCKKTVMYYQGDPACRRRLPHDVRLIGTEVNVKYRSQVPLFAGWLPPN